ncbi:MAG: VanW family protein [Myxococcales bacterium]
MVKSDDAHGQPRDSEHVSTGVRRKVMLAVAGLVGTCALLLTAWFLLSERDAERALPGVQVEGMDVSRLTRDEITKRVQAWGAPRATQKIALSIASTPLVFEPEIAGFAVDAEASARLALQVGRGNGFARGLGSFIARSIHPESVAAMLRFDPARLSALLDDWEARGIDVEHAPFSGGISVDGTNVTPLYPHPGQRLDRARVEEQLVRAVRAGLLREPLATHSEAPLIASAEVERIVARARAMLSGDVELASEDGAHRVTVSVVQLGSVLRASLDDTKKQLQLGCAPEAVHALLEPERAQIEQAPLDARFVIDAQDHVHIEPGHAGLLLDDQAVARALCAAAESAEKKGALPFAPGAQPKLSTEAAEHAGIVGLMGSYTTRHACCQPRVENIHHIADLLDGVLVEAGQTFSVNQLVGPRTVKNGFRPAPSIEDGDMVDTVGGGVSQFATTLFNALFYGGYDILERQPHSYWFTRYPMGYDATLSYPHPDIVFKNDTEAGALIKTSYTDTTITVKVYGNNGGRRVRAEVSERQSIVTPPVEFIPNPRLDADEEKTREGGMIGWTVTVKRILTFPDGKSKEERRKVTYKPRARRVEVHPCRIPAGEPGHTGERCPVPEKDDSEGSAAADAGAK